MIYNNYNLHNNISINMSVYHGSKLKFEVAKPSPTSRGHMKNGKIIIDYKGISLHATPYKWIALAYTGNQLPYKYKGSKMFFNFGVPVKKKIMSLKDKLLKYMANNH